MKKANATKTRKTVTLSAASLGARNNYYPAGQTIVMTKKEAAAVAKELK